VLVAALAVLAVGLAIPAHASAESTFVSKINASRAANGLPPLQVSPVLTSGARSWSNQMMSAGAISHNPGLGSITGGWDALGENVGVGPDPDVLHDAFMASASHRKNILGDYTHVGVGVVVEDETRMWVTVVFMKALDSSPTTTTTTVPPVTTTTVAPTPTTVPPVPVATTTTTAAPNPQPVPTPVASDGASEAPSDPEEATFESYGRPPGLYQMSA
jgi:hypothetical protein